MKDAYYFQHEYHARHDPKTAALIRKFGMVGYGVFWVFIEILHEQRGGKFEKFPAMYEGLAEETKQNEATLKQIIFASINEFSLLREDETHIWSDRVIQNMSNMKAKHTQRAEAGRLGGIKSGEKRKQNEALLEAKEANEAYHSIEKDSIGKNRKEKEIENTNTDTPTENALAALPASQSNQSTFVSKFGEFYQKLSGFKYKADKHDFIIAANLIKDFGYEVLVKKAAILYKACENKSIWFTKNGYADFTIKQLSKHWNELLLESALSDEEKRAAELNKRISEMEERDARVKREIESATNG